MVIQHIPIGFPPVILFLETSWRDPASTAGSTGNHYEPLSGRVHGCLHTWQISPSTIMAGGKAPLSVVHAWWTDLLATCLPNGPTVIHPYQPSHIFYLSCGITSHPSPSCIFNPRWPQIRSWWSITSPCRPPVSSRPRTSVVQTRRRLRTTSYTHRNAPGSGRRKRRYEVGQVERCDMLRSG